MSQSGSGCRSADESISCVSGARACGIELESKLYAKLYAFAYVWELTECVGFAVTSGECVIARARAIDFDTSS